MLILKSTFKEPYLEKIQPASWSGVFSVCIIGLKCSMWPGIRTLCCENKRSWGREEPSHPFWYSKFWCGFRWSELATHLLMRNKMAHKEMKSRFRLMRYENHSSLLLYVSMRNMHKVITSSQCISPCLRIYNLHRSCYNCLPFLLFTAARISAFIFCHPSLRQSR